MANSFEVNLEVVDDEEIKRAVVCEEEIRNSFEEAIESGELHSSISELVKIWRENKKGELWCFE